jgi:hypothetical protein
MMENEAIMIFEKNDSIFPESRSLPKVEHLSYLNRPLSLFEDEDDEALKQTRLLCAACDHPVTKVAEKTEIFGRHHHAFPYYNQMVQLGCFLNAPGSIGVERISHGYSWFRGYAWQIQLCENCNTQLGWKYTSENDSFYGFVFNTLREETEEEQKSRSREKDLKASEE